MRALELAGQRFNRLAVIARAEGPPGQVRWTCRCDCGGIVEAAGARLRLGLVGSCGCIVRTHGHSAGGRRSRVYMAWDSMRSRCDNLKHPAFERYGGRGIKVCERWKSFAKFLADMGEPEPGMTLDRKNNDKGYSKANCRWATRTEQNRNTSANRRVLGKTVAEWSEETGVGQGVICWRLDAGWTPERAVSQRTRSYTI